MAFCSRSGDGSDVAPDLVRGLTLREEKSLKRYAKQIVDEPRANAVRGEGDFSSPKVNGKIQDAETAKVHTMLVVGKRNMESGNPSDHIQGKGHLGAKRNGD